MDEEAVVNAEEQLGATRVGQWANVGEMIGWERKGERMCWEKSFARLVMHLLESRRR